jgi:aryl sulfotransferase
MKVHDAWTRTDVGEPMFPPDVTEGVVYIVRNPLDVAPSAADHFGGTPQAAVERMCRSEYISGTAAKNLGDQLRQRVGSWPEHVVSWVDESGLPAHVVRYEDLCADAVAAFAGIVRFAGLDLDEARVRKAVAFSTFAELHRQEAEVGFRERPAGALGNFFRRGEAGSWAQDLDDELASRLCDACGDTMIRFGYDR